MNLTEHRAGAKEQERIGALLALVPEGGGRALDVGARDGYLSIQLTHRFTAVTALDLTQPDIDHPAVTAVAGDVRALPFDDACFDLVLCAEVLEHLPSATLDTACRELARVTRKHLIVGVPFEQDLRYGQTLCRSCGKSNPPWGHVNAFDDSRLTDLFAGMTPREAAHVGTKNARTTGLATALMSFAGHPFGTYAQDEPCVHCEAPLRSPGSRNSLQKLATRAAFLLNNAQQRILGPHPDWLHMLFEKRR